MFITYHLVNTSKFSRIATDITTALTPALMMTQFLSRDSELNRREQSVSTGRRKLLDVCPLYSLVSVSIISAQPVWTVNNPASAQTIRVIYP